MAMGTFAERQNSCIEPPLVYNTDSHTKAHTFINLYLWLAQRNKNDESDNIYAVYGLS